MIRKILLSTLFSLIMLVSTALASVPESELSIGGIGIGNSGGYVRSVYGNPDEVKNYNWGAIWRYGSFKVILEKNKVISLESRGNNGLSTPAGVSVGMKMSNAYDLYGKADYQGSSQTELIRHPAGCDYHYTYNSSNSMLLILYTKNDVIRAIEIKQGY